jgi:putative CocE/NonD family hydrolase
MKHKQLIIIVLSVCLVIGVGFGVFYRWLHPGNNLSLSLASTSTERVSEPFKYSGYSSAEYSSYTKTSIYVEMDDGVWLAVDIYLPASGPDNGSGSYPVVFQYTPYGRAYIIPEKMGLIEQIEMRIGVGTADNVWDRANSHDTVYGSSNTIVQTLLSYGYAYVCADVRGTGASFGVKQEFMPEMGTDGKKLIDWISAQAWSDGNVGMFGGSYLGYTQLAVAGEEPKALRAIFPEVVAMDGYSTEMRPGGVFCELYSTTGASDYEYNLYLPDDYYYPTAPVVDEDGDGDLWDEIPLDLDGDGIFLNDYNYPDNPSNEPQYADGNKREHIYYLATYEHLENQTYSDVGPKAEFIDTDLNYGTDENGNAVTRNAYDVSPSAFVPKIMETNIAVYNHGSWMDPFITSTTELYNTMKDTNASRMIIDPGYHETYSPFWSYFGEDEDASIKAYAIELVRFFDRYLKGIENGIDTEPAIYIYNMNGDGWRFENEFPLVRQELTNFYFAQNGTLTADQTTVEFGSDDYQADLSHDSSWASKWYDYPVSRYVMAAPDELPYRTEMDKKCLTYTTQAMVEDTEITGYPIITFYVSSTSDDTNFHIYLSDVDEDGNAVLVTEGVIRGGFAATYDNDNMIKRGTTGVDVLPNLPWHGFEEGQYNSEIFADDAIVELTVNLFPTSWLFKEGHSIRVSIACADWPTFEILPELSQTNNPADPETITPVIAVYRDKDYPSNIVLPVIPRTQKAKTWT